MTDTTQPMIINIATPAYDPTKFTGPWIAHCTFTLDNPTGDFRFGTWVGDPGTPGALLLTDVECGDIVATGQRGINGTRSANPTFYLVGDESDLIELPGGRVEAFCLGTGQTCTNPVTVQTLLDRIAELEGKLSVRQTSCVTV